MYSKIEALEFGIWVHIIFRHEFTEMKLRVVL